MGKVKNILFIMADQLRADYLSCYGHPHLETTNIDRLASKGVRFSRAYAQSPVCAPARMSVYTGRYASSHGCTWNAVPLPVGERGFGEFLRPSGMRVALAGKTHMKADLEGMERLGIDIDSEKGVYISQCGFEPYERDDGEHPNQKFDPKLPYNEYLRSKGYDSKNPWNDFANSAEGPDGEILSGWSMRNSHLPARVKEEDSETAYMTNRGIQFLKEQGDNPWCLHLSYIKPHWPYMAPAPYHNMYGQEDRLPLKRKESERENPHPVYRAFMNMTSGKSFSREDVCANVIPAYMGLIKQIDDNLGRVFRYLEETGRMHDTMIVFSSDHGDYLGDHWLGEKELFHEQSARVPLIIYDPDPSADATRGTVDDRLVEAIDIVPTFLEAVQVKRPQYLFEGQSLLPLVRNSFKGEWKDTVFSEINWEFYRARLELGLPPNESRSYMVRTDRWKYVYHIHFRPQLFDLQNDPDEYNDLGEDPELEDVRRDMKDRLFNWFMRRRSRITMSNDVVEQATDRSREMGVIIGQW